MPKAIFFKIKFNNLYYYEKVLQIKIFKFRSSSKKNPWFLMMDNQREMDRIKRFKKMIRKYNKLFLKR